MKILKQWNNRQPLRKWQAQAIRRFYALNKKDFLAVGTPGSGKTVLALKIAHDLLTDDKIERVVIVTPTEHLKRQWAESAARCGIDIDPNWANADGREADDYFGVAVTYQQISYCPDLYDLNCQQRTFVIFDEIHHAADGLDWGDKLRCAFDNAEYRLALSGTPFRSDDNRIPFVRYENRKSCADFTYGYGEALADGVCRPVYFPTFEGNVAWIRGTGEQVKRSMLDDLSLRQSAERLRAALDADGEWLPSVLREADNRLTEMRLAGHQDAAGLVIAIDQYHARRIAKLLKVITNEKAVVAISDEDNSSEMIKQFARTSNGQRWIVAVKMVSEGVDIPRLRVGVYATTVTSELFFRQAVGRFVRIIYGLDEQSAAIYMPADDKLIGHALAIKEEREHFLPEKIVIEPSATDNSLTTSVNGNLNILSEDFSYKDNENNSIIDNADGENHFGQNYSNESNLNDESNNNGRASAVNRQFITPLSSEAVFHDTVFDGQRFSREELSFAESIGKEVGLKIPAAQLAAVIYRVSSDSIQKNTSGKFQKKSLGSSFGLSADSSSRNSPLASPVLNNQMQTEISIKSERKHKLRKRINRLANKLARLTGAGCDEVHRHWIEKLNGASNRKATEDQLNNKLGWLQNQISEVCRRETKKS